MNKSFLLGATLTAVVAGFAFLAVPPLEEARTHNEDGRFSMVVEAGLSANFVFVLDTSNGDVYRCHWTESPRGQLETI